MKVADKPILKLNDEDIERIYTIKRELRTFERDVYNAIKGYEDTDLYETWAEISEWSETIEELLDRIFQDSESINEEES
jgi:hypothetical protein